MNHRKNTWKSVQTPSCISRYGVVSFHTWQQHLTRKSALAVCFNSWYWSYCRKMLSDQSREQHGALRSLVWATQLLFAVARGTPAIPSTECCLRPHRLGAVWVKGHRYPALADQRLAPTAAERGAPCAAASALPRSCETRRWSIFYCCFVLWMREELNKLKHVEAITRRECQVLFRTSNGGSSEKYLLLLKKSLRKDVNSKAFSTAASRKRQRGWMAKPGAQPPLRALQLRGGQRRGQPGAEGSRGGDRSSAALQRGRDAGRRCRAALFLGAPWRQHHAWPRTVEGGVSCPRLEVGRTKCCWGRGFWYRRGSPWADGLSAAGDGGATEASSRLAWSPLRAVTVFLRVLHAGLLLCGEGE